MTQAVLHGPSGEVLVTLPLPSTPVAPKLVYMDREYEYVGFQDGTAYYNALWSASG